MKTLNDMNAPQPSKSDGVRAPEIKRREVEGNWMAQKDKLKKKFGALTDADLAFEKGKKEEMLARVETKIGKSREELLTIIAAL